MDTVNSVRLDYTYRLRMIPASFIKRLYYELSFAVIHPSILTITGICITTSQEKKRMQTERAV